MKKEIAKKTEDQTKQNKLAIENHENKLKEFHTLMKKRPFYTYGTGTAGALEAL